ncbi:MAG: PaaI family thioesterase [Ruminococcus sp.]|nr:PaaI family thioesterase [Ruminococcus sp.]MBR2304973.1 PaaI family thioesterase [Ruminococcus sp.]
MANIEQVREFFSKDRFATENGAVIDEVREDYARVSLTIDERHKNAVGGVMGGVYFMLADFAFAVATNWQKPGTVSLSSDISFLSTPKGKRLIAETELIRKGRTTCCYNVMVRDDLGKPIAAVKIVGYIG